MINIFKYISFKTPIKFDTRSYKIDKRNRGFIKALNNSGINSDLIQDLSSIKYDQSLIKISFIVPCRYKDNLSCLILGAITSIYENADDAKKIEFLIAVDRDDDLGYFLSLKNSFLGKVNIRIFVADENYGYERLNKYQKILFSNMSKSSLIGQIFSDDSIITLKGFDSIILSEIGKYDDGIFIIKTDVTPRDKIDYDCAQNFYILPYFLHRFGPKTMFPGVSSKIIEIAEEYINRLPKNESSEWSPISNTWLLDSYVDIINVLMEKKGIRRMLSFKMLERDSRYDFKIPSHKKKDKLGLFPADRGFMELYKYNNISILEGIVDEIITKIKN